MDYPVGRLTLAEARAGKARQLASQKQFDLADEQLVLARKAAGRSAEVEHATALVLRDRDDEVRDRLLRGE